MTKSIVFFADSYGATQLSAKIPHNKIAAIVASENRPQYHEHLQKIANNIHCEFLIQPQKTSEMFNVFHQKLSSLCPDLLLCFSYSMKVPDPILNVFSGKCFNIHASFLPKNRGPNPIQWSLIHDDPYTGITCHKMATEFDSGDILLQVKVLIEDSDTWVSLKDKINKVTPDFIEDCWGLISSGDYVLSTQDVANIRTNNRLNADYPLLDFELMSDREIFNIIRAQVAPLPGAYYYLDGKKNYISEFMSEEEVKRLREKLFSPNK